MTVKERVNPGDEVEDVLNFWALEALRSYKLRSYEKACIQQIEMPCKFVQRSRNFELLHLRVMKYRVVTS